MKNKKVQISKVKFWFVVSVLFICGLMVGIGIANWGHAVKVKYAADTTVMLEQKIDEDVTSCQAIEKVLLNRLCNDDNHCGCVQGDLDVFQHLAAYGCPENHDKYMQMIQNKNAVLLALCRDLQPDEACLQIEQNLQNRLGDNYVSMDAGRRIERAKIYAIMAERGCPENSAKYVELAKKELEIARGINDDEFNQKDTIEVVETYKRLKMQSAADEIFDKAKRLTNPAIDFIMQVEKIINE